MTSLQSLSSFSYCKFALAFEFPDTPTRSIFVYCESVHRSWICLMSHARRVPHCDVRAGFSMPPAMQFSPLLLSPPSLLLLSLCLPSCCLSLPPSLSPHHTLMHTLRHTAILPQGQLWALDHRSTARSHPEHTCVCLRTNGDAFWFLMALSWSIY